MAKKTDLGADFDLLEAFWAEKVDRTILENGATLLVKEDHFAPVASVQVWVKTGSIHEGPLMGSGVSHYLEHMLFKGTEKRQGREISTAVQAHGGYVNAYTTFDRTVYYIDLPSEHVKVALDILSDAVLNSTLPADEVKKEKDVILREIDMGKDDPDHRLSEALFETAFRTHPFRQPIIGHRDVFSGLGREELAAYYKERYAPNNLVIVVVGDVSAAEIRGEVTRLFGAAPRRRISPVLIENEPPQLAPREYHRFEDVEVSRAGMAWPIPEVSHPDAPLLDLVATLLGGGDSSVFWQSLREKAQLVHTIDAHSWTPAQRGLFYVSFSCDPDKRSKAAEGVVKEIERCARIGFKSAELTKALRQIIVSEINSRKTMSGQAGRLGGAEVIVGDIGHARLYFERLRTVKSADLQRVIRQYLVPERCTRVSLNPEAARPKVDGTSSSTGARAVEFEMVQLPNGARIVFQEDHRLPNVHVRWLVQGGPLFEDPARRGSTALTATLLTKDTKKRSAAQVAEMIESVGGALYPFSGNNSFGVAAEVVPTEIDLALELVSDAVLAPAFLPQTVARERDAQIADLQQELDDVVSYGRRLLRRKFFGGHPFAMDAAGTPETVEQLKPKDLAALWKRCLVGPNTVLAIAGAFDRRKVLPQLKKLLSRLPKASLVRPKLKVESAAEVGDFVDLQPREQAVVFQAFPAPGLMDEDYYVSEVADELFSGMSSRLFERVREEKGLAYFVRSARVPGLDTGMFAFFAGTSPKTYEEVLREIDLEIDRVQKGRVELEELKRCQLRLKAARRMGLQTNSSRAMQAGLNALYGLPVNDWQNYDRYIDAVTLDRIQAFAKKYFRKSLRTQLVVKPSES